MKSKTLWNFSLSEKFAQFFSLKYFYFAKKKTTINYYISDYCLNLNMFLYTSNYRSFNLISNNLN